MKINEILHEGENELNWYKDSAKVQSPGLGFGDSPTDEPYEFPHHRTGEQTVGMLKNTAIATAFGAALGGGLGLLAGMPTVGAALLGGIAMYVGPSMGAGHDHMQNIRKQAKAWAEKNSGVHDDFQKINDILFRNTPDKIITQLAEISSLLLQKQVEEHNMAPMKYFDGDSGSYKTLFTIDDYLKPLASRGDLGDDDHLNEAILSANAKLISYVKIYFTKALPLWKQIAEKYNISIKGLHAVFEAVYNSSLYGNWLERLFIANKSFLNKELDTFSKEVEAELQKMKLDVDIEPVPQPKQIKAKPGKIKWKEKPQVASLQGRPQPQYSPKDSTPKPQDDGKLGFSALD